MLAVLLLGAALLPWALARDEASIRTFERTNPAATLQAPALRAGEAGEGAATVALLGTDRLGRDLLARCVVGGAVSLGVGLAAALIAVVLGTAWGTLSATLGGRWDAALMRIVDVFYGLPAILLVVLVGISTDSLLERLRPAAGAREAINLAALLLAIGAVSWLTVARVVRGQVLSIQQRPAMEAARAIGVPPLRRFTHHLLPSLVGPILVYATLAVPSAILAEAFLSFLGIGVREPLPSWGNLAADGLGELNSVHSRWWLLLWPCCFIATTLVAINALGERLRDVVDPRSATVAQETT